MKSHPVGAEVFHEDGQTDMIQLMVAFRNSANAPKKKKSGLACDVVAACHVMRTWLVKLISTLAERCCITDCYTCYVRPVKCYQNK